MKARLKKELGQTGGFVSVLGEIFVAQEASWFGLLSTSLDARDA